MAIDKFSYTGKMAEVAFKAMYLCCFLGTTFTIEAFCAYAEMLPNRHTRKMLKRLCDDGILFRTKRIGRHGGYPMTYEAQTTKRFC